MFTKKHIEAFKNASPYYQRGGITVTTGATLAKEGKIIASKIESHSFYVEHVERPVEYKSNYWALYYRDGICKHIKNINQLFKSVGAEIELVECGSMIDVLQKGRVTQKVSPFEQVIIHEKQ